VVTPLLAGRIASREKSVENGKLRLSKVVGNVTVISRVSHNVDSSIPRIHNRSHSRILWGRSVYLAKGLLRLVSLQAESMFVRVDLQLVVFQLVAIAW
jgi:hypothetical protein